MTRISPWLWAKTSFAKYASALLAKPPAVSVTTRHVPEPRPVWVPTRHGDVRCLVYRPHPDAPLAADGHPPVHIHLHGGGFVLTNPRQDDFLATYVAAEVGAVVVSVDYSTAPQVRFPVAEEQSADVLAWVAASGHRMGWDGERIGIGGVSAGAKLALAALQLAHRDGGPAARAAVTLVPPVDVSISADELHSSLPHPMIDARMLRILHGTYFVEQASRRDPLASPALDPHIADALPPLLVMTGEHDTLTTTATELVRRVAVEGADVTHLDLAAVDHDLGISTHPETIVDTVLEPIGEHLRRHLA